MKSLLREAHDSANEEVTGTWNGKYPGGSDEEDFVVVKKEYALWEMDGGDHSEKERRKTCCAM